MTKQKLYNRVIFIFRRDLRLEDNTGLINALKTSKSVVPIFIFVKEQVKNNVYKSNNCVQFMVESLYNLDDSLRKKGSKLYYFYGKPHSVIDSLLKDDKLDIDAVFINKDYTPYSVERDLNIKKVCDKHKVDLVEHDDYMLNPVGSVPKVYKKFTPYFNVSNRLKVKAVDKNSYKNYVKSDFKIKGQLKYSFGKQFYKQNNSLAVNGGRTEGLKLLKAVKTKQRLYDKRRDDLTYSTTHLSPHIKFGTVSIREVYFEFKPLKNSLIKQLHWRDFYYNIVFHFPHVLNKTGNRNFNKKYSKIPWLKWNTSTSSSKKRLFTAWCTGNTGYPVVDASMREMNSTGFIGNRSRLIVASFLTKLMMWHWEDGEKYFAQTLLDYDPAQNSGNWQWCSGSGVDAQPYFRIFNPWEQGKRYDPDCKYIKKWIPELKDVSPKQIHTWYNSCNDYKLKYPKPIIDYEDARDKAKTKFAKALY